MHYHHYKSRINTGISYGPLQGEALLPGQELPGQENATCVQRMQRLVGIASGYWLRDYSNIEVH